MTTKFHLPKALTRRLPLLGLALLALAPASLSPLAPAAPAYAHDAGRYTMLETKDGVVRLDKRSGALSTCVKDNDNWDCTPMSDGEDTSIQTPESQEELAELRRENLLLKQRIANLEANKTPLPDEEQKLNLPSDEEVDEAIGYMERMIRKFRGAMKRLRENEQEPPTEL